MYTIVVQEKPARPWVALIVCSLLLVSVSVAAWRFSQQRSFRSMPTLTHPPGWPISFFLHPSWEAANEGAPDLDRQLIYHRRGLAGNRVRLIITRHTAPHREFSRECIDRYRSFFGPLDVALIPYEQPRDVQPGLLTGSYFVVPDRGYLLFTGGLEKSAGPPEFYSVEILTAPPMIGMEIHGMEQLLESVEPLTPSLKPSSLIPAHANS